MKKEKVLTYMEIYNHLDRPPQTTILFIESPSLINVQNHHPIIGIISYSELVLRKEIVNELK